MTTNDARRDSAPATPLLRRRDAGALALMPWLAGGALAQQGMTLRGKLGPLYGHGSRLGQPARFGKRHWDDAASPIVRWNEVAIDASGLDHTPVAAGETRVFGEHLGPCRSSRAMAIVHIAIADAVQRRDACRRSLRTARRAGQPTSPGPTSRRRFRRIRPGTRCSAVRCSRPCGVFYGTDRIGFRFVSDEFNGETLDNQGRVRLLAPRSFTSLSQAEEENGRSRIYLGIHWAFDCTQGIVQGQRVADSVFARAYNPRSRRS